MTHGGPQTASSLEEDAHAPSGVFATSRPTSAASTIVHALCDAGIDVFFGIPGGPIIPIFDAILTEPRAQLIEPRHETTGTFAAIGFHRASGRVPAVVVTAGPGATNVLTGVVAVHLERVPMIVICGDVPWASTGKRLLQQTAGDGIGVERVYASVTRAVIRVARGSSASAQIQAAIEVATRPENPGPVLVVVSVDTAGAPVAPIALHVPPRASEPRAPAIELVQDVAERLRRAKRPLVILGAGCRGHEEAVARMIDALGVPFATTPQAKGLVSERHPLSLRNCGMGASWWARRYTRGGCDATLVLGTDLDDVSVAGTPPVASDGFLAHVDLDPNVFARNHPTAIGVVSDVGAFAGALAAVVRAGNANAPALLAATRAESLHDAPGFADDDATPIAPHRVIADLQRASRPEDVFVSDIGEHMLFALHYLQADRPDRFVIHLGLGSMGSGIGSAIGLSLASKDRRVICVCGDGGMQMAGMELLVAVKLGLPVVFAVFNDARYNMVYHGYRYTFGREASFSTPEVDFAEWARALGARGVRIERPGQITRELLDASTEGGVPVVLDVRIDPSIRIKGDGRVEAIAQMSMLHAGVEP